MEGLLYKKKEGKVPENITYAFSVACSSTHRYAQVVANLQQTCNNVVPTSCQQDVFVLLVPSLLSTIATRLLSSTDLLQVVPTTCYRLEIQQFINKL